MIVTPHTANAIRSGRITQIRVPRLDGWPVPLRVGHDYPVQVRRGKRITGEGSRIEVIATYPEVAGDITYTGARGEGYRTTDEWKVNWVRRHDLGYRAQRIVNDDLWRTGLVDGILLARFEQRHAAAPAWTVTFKVISPQRYLARPTRTSGDYVRHPGRAIDRVECVDEATQERYAKMAQADSERRRASARRALQEERAGRRTGNLSTRALRHITDAADRRDG